jgi:hypothetical protein
MPRPLEKEALHESLANSLDFDWKYCIDKSPMNPMDLGGNCKYVTDRTNETAI